MMKILFVHGLASSGAYKMATMLRQLMRPCEVIAPDLPIKYSEAMCILESMCSEQDPDLVVGLSWGGFLTQKLFGRRKVLVNPDLRISGILRTKIGRMEYLSPRADGETSFEITSDICSEYELAQAGQFSFTDPELTLGLFADNDELVDCSALFEQHYPGRGFQYPGGHLPTYKEMKFHIVPRIKAFLEGGPGA